MEQRILRRRMQMIVYALPNFFLALFGIAWVVKEFGWASLLSLPYVILLVWLLFTAIIVIFIRWQETEACAYQ